MLTFRGLTQVWPLYVLAALGSAVGAFDLPARGALVPTLVPREHLPNAISLNTIMFQTASVVGPSLGGLMIASTGVGWVYVANAISFGFVIVALLMMRDVPAHPTSESGKRDEVSLHAAMEGLRFVFRSPIIRSTMLLDFFATFFSSATALLPIFAQDILQVGAKGYGWLYAAPAVGAMATSAALVPLADRIERRGPTLLWAVGGYGLATVVFGFSRSFWLTFACLMLTGATDTVSMVIRNIVRQLETPDRLRGRMMGVNMVFFMGGPQLGELEAGRGGELARRAVLGDQRRHRLSARDRLGRRGDSRLAALRAHQAAENTEKTVQRAETAEQQDVRIATAAWPADGGHYPPLSQPRSTTMKYGSAIAESAAATPKADAKP